MDSNTIPDTGKELTRVFVSYAREDKKWLDPDNPRNLIPFLEDSLRRQNVVFWYDKGLIPGDEFKRRIRAEIDRAQIALLIVSQYFLNSQFIETEEMPRIADRAKLGQMVIVPILVESCDWNEYVFLADRQMVPASRPLIEFTDSDIRWSSVRKEILDGVKAQVKRIQGERERVLLQGGQESPAHESPREEIDGDAKVARQRPSPVIDSPINNIEPEKREEQEAGSEADAFELYREQERLCRELGNKEGLQLSLNSQGIILYTRGELDKAMELFKESERICRELGNKAGLQLSLNYQGSILYTCGELDRAMELYKESERLCRELGNREGLQYCLGNQGLILAAHGDQDGAMALYKEQERICHELGNKAGLQLVLNYQGSILFTRGELDRAMELYKESERLCRELGNRSNLAILLGNQGLILAARGDQDGAMALYKEQERICHELGNKAGLQLSLINLGSILYNRGELDKAMALYKESERICRELGNKAGLQLSLNYQGSILYTRGELDKAMALYKESERLCRELGNKKGLQSCLGNQAAILEARRVKDGATALNKKTEPFSREPDSPNESSTSRSSQAWAVPSTPHASADGNLASQMNMKYQAEKKRWDALPWRKRIKTPEPKRPVGI